MSTGLLEEIRGKIEGTGWPLTELLVRDDHEACAGSVLVVVVSDKWEGMGPLDRAREINAVIAEEVKHIHALSVRAFTPAQWEKQKEKFN